MGAGLGYWCPPATRYDSAPAAVGSRSSRPAACICPAGSERACCCGWVPWADSGRSPIGTPNLYQVSLKDRCRPQAVIAQSSAKQTFEPQSRRFVFQYILGVGDAAYGRGCVKTRNSRIQGVAEPFLTCRSWRYELLMKPDFREVFGSVGFHAGSAKRRHSHDVTKNSLSAHCAN